MRISGIINLLSVSVLAVGVDGFQSPSTQLTPMRMTTSLGAEPAVADETDASFESGRRQALALFGSSLVFIAGASGQAGALDMDAFMQKELNSDKDNCDPKSDPKCIPKLNADEALCKYGQSGSTARSEACKRVKQGGGELPSSQPQGKSLGGAYAM
eukprot:CAMPEP_0198141218 /NCGR_PEP_ID=MMETSP1443-20131203/4254_1 /TAXON_ID=186043 /ORGANISM="Entomoneis sp., Strain CCMP2396" /LENGTH=156 /DNA_ID=CAMNT_0043803889 /DNA_START=159 /DNA_END=629 /DNA_ORIENTATION=+